MTGKSFDINTAPKYGRRGGQASAAQQATLYYLDGVRAPPWTHATLAETYGVPAKNIANGIAKLRKDGVGITWAALEARFRSPAEGEQLMNK